MRSVFMATLFAVWSVALAGASCDKKTAADPGPKNIPPPSDPVANDQAVAGVDLKGLNDDQKAAFQKLVDSVQSPCGKAQSLRAAVKDPSCKRAPYAGRYLVRRLAEGTPAEDVEKLYQARYLPEKTYTFALEHRPFAGVPNAPVVLVEFFDYGCPHCKMFAPMLEDIQAEFPSDIVIYYKNFPLSSHPESVPAAIAAAAAARQGKYRDMHLKLFVHQDAQSKDDLFKYAKEIGLDMAKFEKDFNDPAVRALVEEDRADGERGDLSGTPTLYINGKKWPEDEGMSQDEIMEWIREELAVNR